MNLHKIFFIVAFALSFIEARAQDTTYGCNDPNACNYEAPGDFTVNSGCIYPGDTANEANGAGICIYDDDCNCISPVFGCADMNACNYLSSATISQGCIYSSANGNTSYGCWVCSQTEGDSNTGWGDGQGILQDDDINDNGICDDIEVIGCMDALACNYDPSATAESAFADAGSPCQYLENSCDYCGLYTSAGAPDSLILDGNGEFLATHPDYGVLNGDENNNGTCDDNEVYGCMDELACNFDANATADTSIVNPVCISAGPCGCDGVTPLEIPQDACDCSGAVLDALGNCLLQSDLGYCELDDNENGICDNAEVAGCTDESACNYNENANVDDDSCATLDICGECAGGGIPQGYCNCDSTLEDQNGNGLCDNDEIQGCTNPDKCNFNPDATFSVESECLEFDACNVCGGSGPEDPSHCDCDGNVLDALGVCGGKCPADVDGDGICDTVDPCLVAGEELDLCGVCGGGVTAENVGDEFDCGCFDLPDEACDCETDGTVDYPDPGKDCDGNCLNGTDENGQCIISSNEVVTNLPDPIINFQDGNKVIKSVNVFDQERFFARIDTLHSRMSKNLDDGSLLGKSDTLTIEHQILDKGKLFVLEDAVFSDIVRMDTNVIIGGNLHVMGSATIEGTTFANGGLQTSTLDVAGDLNVGGAVRVDSTLDVTDFVDFHDSLRVAEAIQVGLDNQFIADSAGSVRFEDGFIRDSLTVVGKSIFQDDLKLAGSFNINAGSFQVDGSGNAIAQSVSTVGDITVGGNHSITGSISASKNATFSKSATIGQNLTVGGTLQFNGNYFHSKAKRFLVGSQASSIPTGGTNQIPTNSYSMIIDGKGAGNYNGIAIRVDENNVHSYNNFVTFLNGSGTQVGRIQGQNTSDKYSDPVFESALFGKNVDIAVSTGQLAWNTYKTVSTFLDVGLKAGNAAASAIPGAGLPDSDVAETIGHSVAAGIKAAEGANYLIEAVLAGIKLTTSTVGRANLIARWDARIGISYRSGAGDYAEWLPKFDVRDDLLPGEIVGVSSGRVSRFTKSADHLLVVSTSPIVLGNDPGVDKEGDYEMIAFMGQVPVRVIGRVSQGDYILPSGDNDGYGMALSKEEITLDMVPQIVAIAWESGDSDYFNIVNCSVGLDNQGLQALVELVDERLVNIENSIDLKIDNHLKGVSESPRTGFSLKSIGKKKRTASKKNSLAKESNTNRQDERAIPRHEDVQAFAAEDIATAVKSEISKLIDQGLQISPEEWKEGADDLVSAYQLQANRIEDAVSKGYDISVALNVSGEAQRAAMRYDAIIQRAVFDSQVNFDSIKEILRDCLSGQVGDMDRDDLELVTKLLKPGSEAEQKFINEFISTAEEALFTQSPHTEIYTRGRKNLDTE